MKIARNLLELSINAEYLRMQPAAVDDYVEWFWVEQHNWLTYARQHDPELLKQFLPKAIQYTEQEFARVRSRFEKPHNPKDLRGSWCAVDLGTRAAHTDMAVPYRLISRFGSQFLHGTAGAMLNHFDVKVDLEQIAATPSLKWCRQALCGGHNCLAMMIHSLATMFNEEGDPPADQVAQDFVYAWPRPFSRCRRSEALHRTQPFPPVASMMDE
jgi:hypothetical protein